MINRYLDGSVGVATCRLADIATWLVKGKWLRASYRFAAHSLQNNIPWHAAREALSWSPAAAMG